MISKSLVYPNIPINMYTISKDGRVYSILNESYIHWSVRYNMPYVNLSCIKHDKRCLEPFYIKDLVAYNYLEESDNYLERGYKVVNIDGNTMNCNSDNLVYIKSSL